MNKTLGIEDKGKYKSITVEEHFSTPEHLDQLRAILDKKYIICFGLSHGRSRGGCYIYGFSPHRS